MESIQNEFELRKSNGTLDDKIKLDEKIRFEKITNSETNFSHLWFEGVYKIEPQYNLWDLNKRCMCLTFNQYQKQLSKVNLYCLELTNIEYLNNLITNINYLNKLIGTKNDPGYIVIGTLDSHILRLYQKLFPESAKELIKYFIFDKLSLFKKVNSSTKLKTSSNTKIMFDLDEELKEFLLANYLKEFVVEIKEIINVMIDDHYKKIEMLNIKLDKLVNQNNKKIFIEDINTNNNNIRDLTNLLAYVDLHEHIKNSQNKLENNQNILYCYY
jgi:hypothetical protein